MLTRYSPVRRSNIFHSAEASFQMSSLDLHVLSTPPAFVLSQDQTLMFNPYPLSSDLSCTGLAKVLCSQHPFKRRFTLSESDCSFVRLFFFSVSFSRIGAVVSELPCEALSPTTFGIISDPNRFVNTFFSTFQNPYIVRLFQSLSRTFPEHWGWAGRKACGFCGSSFYIIGG